MDNTTTSTNNNNYFLKNCKDGLQINKIVQNKTKARKKQMCKNQ